MTKTDGDAERETAVAMIYGARQALSDLREITLGAEKGYDAAEFVQACQAMNVTPHVGKNESVRNSAVSKSIVAGMSAAC